MNEAIFQNNFIFVQIESAMKKILFIICNYNAHASGALGESLKRLKDIKDDNIVISYFDHGSRDGSEDML